MNLNCCSFCLLKLPNIKLSCCLECKLKNMKNIMVLCDKCYEKHTFHHIIEEKEMNKSSLFDNDFSVEELNQNFETFDLTEFNKTFVKKHKDYTHKKDISKYLIGDDTGMF
tara:strand:+ start:1862 stop:2194 length:333 start_codon:yes stop_codon:yes gene_type:complete